MPYKGPPESIKCWFVSHQWARKGGAGKSHGRYPQFQRGKRLVSHPAECPISPLCNSGEDNGLWVEISEFLLWLWVQLALWPLVAYAISLGIFSFIKYRGRNLGISGIFYKSTIVVKAGGDPLLPLGSPNWIWNNGLSSGEHYLHDILAHV